MTKRDMLRALRADLLALTRRLDHRLNNVERLLFHLRDKKRLRKKRRQASG